MLSKKDKSTKEVDRFELQLDKTLAGYATHKDIFEMLLLVINSEDVQERILENYRRKYKEDDA